MVNSLDIENILAVRGGVNNNVIAIDPNKIRDTQNGGIIDRYIKQEDLILYANLKVVKKPQTSILYNTNTNKLNTEYSGAININLLNPIKESKDGVITYKNKLTTDYTDYFTSSKINNSTSNNFFDPELFGISSISVSQNPSFIPKVTIEFIDVQGKTLFENGDHPDNPYNLFYSFPYPTFILTIKGYYGKAVDYPLVLMKSNTKFDPESGSYKITAEFLSRTFSIYNSFLLIYAFVAPFMFKDDNGEFLGGKILNQIYDIQNSYYQKLPPSEHPEKYLIKNNPTLLYLQKVKDHLDNQTLTNDADITANLSLISNIDSVIIGIRQYYEVTLAKGDKFTDIEQNSNIQNINNYLTSISDQDAKSGVNTVLSDYKKYLDSSNNLTIDILKPANVNDLKILINKIFDGLEKRKKSINETIINKKIFKLSDKLGFEPNAFNIYRILFNNIQTFLILVNIANKKALSQILTDTDDLGNKRIINQEINGEYTLDANKNKSYFPFPNYFLTDGSTYKKVYPGYHSDNQGWSEVEFVDEIYKAIDYLKTQIQPQSNNVTATKETVLIDNFDISFNLENYSNTDNHFNIIANMLRKFQLNNIYSGNVFRGIRTDDLKTLIDPLSNTEFDLFSDSILSKLDNGQQISLINNFNMILSDRPYDSIISNLTSALTPAELTKLKNEIKDDIIKHYGKNIKKIITKYKKINLQFIDLLSSNVSPLHDPNNILDGTPIFDMATYGTNSSYFIPEKTMGYFSDIQSKITTAIKSSDKTTDGYVFGTKNNLTIISGTTKSSPYKVINNYQFDGKIFNYGKNIPTLTMTINDNDVLNDLIGFDNKAVNDLTFNTNDDYKF